MSRQKEVRIKTLFDPNGNKKVITVPRNQRKYVWKEENCERLWDDLHSVVIDKGQYFMGILMFEENKNKNSLEVIDGQQRLMTILVLMKLFSKESNNLRKGFKSLFTKEEKPCFEASNRDQKTFNAIMSEDEKDMDKRTYLAKAYKYFNKNIEKGSIERSELYKACRDKLYFYAIYLQKSDNAQQMFNAINSTGVQLTAAELVKNFLFKKEDEGFFQTYWEDVFEKKDEEKYWDETITGQGRANIDVFLQSSLMVENKEGVLATRLFQEYRRYIKDQKEKKEQNEEEVKKTLAILIKEDAGIYKKGIDPFCRKEDRTDLKPIDRLNLLVFGCRIAPMIPYIFYILKEVRDKVLQDKMFDILENYLARQELCQEMTGDQYRILAAQLIEKECKDNEELRKQLITGEKNYKYKTDSNLDEIVSKNSYTGSTNIRTLLYLLETKIRGSKTPGIAYKGLELEHMMPKKWANKWQKEYYPNDKKGSPEYEGHDSLVYRLGNLTLLTRSHNAGMKNDIWDKKKEDIKKYSNGFKILEYEEGGKNMYYYDKPEWKKDEVNHRTKELCRKVKEAWISIIDY